MPRKLMMLSLLVALSLLSLNCTTTKNYTIIYFDEKSIGEEGRVDISLETQFSTSKTVSPSTELDASIVPKELREIKKDLRDLRDSQRSLQKGPTE